MNLTALIALDYDIGYVIVLSKHSILSFLSRVKSSCMLYIRLNISRRKHLITA